MCDVPSASTVFPSDISSGSLADSFQSTFLGGITEGRLNLDPGEMTDREKAAMLLGGPTAVQSVQDIFYKAQPGQEASSLRAKIAREQWEDYKKRFQPLENVLIGWANDPAGFKAENRARALGRVERAYGLAQPQIERRLQSYGLQVTPEMEARIAQRLGYDKSLAQVQAANMSDRLSQDQLQGIVSGGLLTTNRQSTQNQRPTGG